jgi:hypothetical protein
MVNCQMIFYPESICGDVAGFPGMVRGLQVEQAQRYHYGGESMSGLPENAECGTMNPDRTGDSPAYKPARASLLIGPAVFKRPFASRQSGESCWEAFMEELRDRALSDITHKPQNQQA